MSTNYTVQDADYTECDCDYWNSCGLCCAIATVSTLCEYESCVIGKHMFLTVVCLHVGHYDNSISYYDPYLYNPRKLEYLVKYLVLSLGNTGLFNHFADAYVNKILMYSMFERK